MNAVGIILSLPTKIYLTLLLMEREERDNKNTHWQDRIKQPTIMFSQRNPMA